MTKARRYSVPALAKGLDVLELLAHQRVAQSLTEMARALRRSPSELFRMLSCLESRGYLRRDAESGSYSLTLRLYQLAHAHSPVDQLLKVAARPMRELTAEVNESCHLSVLNGCWQLVLAQNESPKPIRLSIEVGGRFPAVHTNSGRLLLAHLPAEELAEALETDPAYAKLKPGQRQRWHKRLEQIRGKEYSSAPSETTLGVHDLAVLAGYCRGRAMAALAIPLLRSPEQPGFPRHVLRSLQRCAKNITQSLGLRYD